MNLRTLGWSKQRITFTCTNWEGCWLNMSCSLQTRGLFCAHDHLPPLKKSSESLRRSVSTLSSPWPPQSPDVLPLERDKFITVLLMKISVTTKRELQSGNKMMETARHLDSLSKAALAQHFSMDEVWRSEDTVRPVSWIYSKRLWPNHFFFLR